MCRPTGRAVRAVAGDIYYAKGGAHDLIGCYATEQEAGAAADALNISVYKWWHIYDLETATIVRQSEQVAYDARHFWSQREYV